MSAAKWRRAMAAGSAAPAVALPAHLQLVATTPQEARVRGNWLLALQDGFRGISAWQVVVVPA